MKSLWKSGLPVVEIHVNTQVFDIFVAADEASRKKGLSELPRLGQDEGMILVFPKPGNHSIWMKGVEFPLDILFLNDKGEVIMGKTGQPGDETSLTCDADACKYVLELPSGCMESCGIDGTTKIRIPKSVTDIKEEVTEDAPQVKLLDEAGNVQMHMKGGERVFSRKSTKKMLALAQNAQTDDELIALGKFVAEEVLSQDSRSPEYTEDGMQSYDLNNTTDNGHESDN